MFQVMIHTQSTELVVNSQAFWIGIVFMPSWVPPSSIETRLFLCSWLLLQCYRYQDQEVQAYQKQLFKVQIKYHVGRVKLLQLPMSTYWILVADHLTWGRQQRNPFYTTIFWKLKVPATKRIDCVRIRILLVSTFLRAIYLDLPCALEDFNALRNSDKWSTQEPTIWASWIWWLGTAYLWFDNEVSFVFPSLPGGYSKPVYKGKCERDCTHEQNHRSCYQ